ncbi:hypothetical protein PHET_07356 [Paragonimus heterotremus]|uniref:Uncharacterized protein n=1 Tax=Paragonimus heterotremus TaxID=100268 RepID=A0A8J4SM24_9TREM|nr:hypothetical protein PHET_07356 [Paragonimus heterotremus]
MTLRRCPSYSSLLSRRRTLTSNALRIFVEAKKQDHQRVCKLLGLVKAKPTPKCLFNRETSVQTGNSIFTCFTNTQDLLCQTVPLRHTENVGPDMRNRLGASIIHRSTSPALSHPPPYSGLDRAFDPTISPSKLLLNYADINDVFSFECSSCTICSCRTADKDDVSTDYWIPAPKSPPSNKTTDSWNTELTTHCQEFCSTNLSC